MTALERPGPMVEVEWVDSFGHSHWADPEVPDQLLEKMACLSAGYLIRDKPEGIVIVLGVGGQGGWLDPMAIPREAVKRITHLEPATTPRCEQPGCGHPVSNHVLGVKCSVPGCSCTQYRGRSS